MSFVHSPKIVTDGLVLSLDAGNTKSYMSGSTTWFDKSGRGNNGTLTNGPTFNSSNGGSIVFDGADDYVTMGNILNDGILAGTNNKFTLGAWVYKNIESAQGSLIAKSADSNLGVNQRQLIYNFRNSKFDFVYIGKPDTSGYFRVITTINTYNIQQWYNTYITYDGSINTNNGLDRVKIYINGQLVPIELTFAQGTLNNTIEGGTAQLAIGATVSNSGGSFGNIDAKISIAQIYNRALSASEVLQNYNATKSRFGLI
jgi:hypothetical protein